MGYLSFKLESLYLNLKEQRLMINGKEIPLKGLTDFKLTTQGAGWHISGKRDIIFEVCEKHDHKERVESGSGVKSVKQQQSKNGVSGMMVGGTPEPKYVIPCPKPKKAAIQNSFGEGVTRLGMKGCKTIAEYAIRQWLARQGFQMAFFNLDVHENEGVLIDHNGDTLLLVYDKETKSVYAKE